MNAWLQGFCRLHCDVFPVPSCLLWLCSHADGGGCWGRQRCVLAAEVYRACSCTEGRGTGCGLRQAELSEKPYNRSQGSLGQQAGSAATVPLARAAACGASSSLCLYKGTWWKVRPILRAALLKRDQNILAPCAEGKGSPD